MAELSEVEAGSCPGCGWHEAVIEGNVFAPVDRKCPVCAGKVQWERALHHDDELERENKTAAKAPPATPLAADGRWTHMTLLSPDEVARRRGGPHGDTP